MADTLNDGVISKLSTFTGTAQDRIGQWLRTLIVNPLPPGTLGVSDLWNILLNERGFFTGTQQENIKSLMEALVLTSFSTYNDAQRFFWNTASIIVPASFYDLRVQLSALPAALIAVGAVFTRATVKNVNHGGVNVQLAIDQFGTSFDCEVGIYGYLAEGSATNKFWNSQQYSLSQSVQGAWAVDSSTAPDGTYTADKFVPSIVFSPHYFSTTFTNLPGIHTYSTYMRPSGSTQYDKFVLYNSTFTDEAYFTLVGQGVAEVQVAGIAATVCAMAGGWYRISYSYTATANDTISIFMLNDSFTTDFSGDGVFGVDVWGGQFEVGSRASSYIVTPGSADVSRAADSLYVPVANIVGFDPAQYTLYADCRSENAPSGQQIFCAVTDGPQDNYGWLYADPTYEYNGAVRSGGNPQAGMISVGRPPTTVRKKLGMAMILDNILPSLNGTSTGITPDTLATMPVGVVNFQIGRAQTNAYIYRAALITTALDQTQLNLLTTT